MKKSFEIYLANLNSQDVLALFEDPKQLRNILKDKNITLSEAIQTLYDHILNFRFKPKQKELFEYRIKRNSPYYKLFPSDSYSRFLAPSIDFSDLKDNKISYTVNFANTVIDRKQNLEKFLKSKSLTELQNYDKQPSILIENYPLPIKEILNCLSKSRLSIYNFFQSCDLKSLAERLQIKTEILDNLFNNLYCKNELNKTEIRIVNNFINIFNRQKKDYSDDDAIILTLTKTFEIFPAFKYGRIDIDKIQLKFNMDDISYNNSKIIADSLKFPIEKLKILIKYITELCNKIEPNELENKLLNFLIATSKKTNLNPQNNNSYIEFFSDVLKFYPNILSIISFKQYLSTVDTDKIKSFFKNPILLKNEHKDINFVEKLYILYDFIINSKFTAESEVLYFYNKIKKRENNFIVYLCKMNKTELQNFLTELPKTFTDFNKINKLTETFFILPCDIIKLFLKACEKYEKCENELIKFLNNMDVNKLKDLLKNDNNINELSEKFYIYAEDIKKIISSIISNYERKKNTSECNEFTEGFGSDLYNTINNCPKLETVDKSVVI